MSRIVLYFLVFLVSFAYSYETIKVIGGVQIAIVDDLDCNKNESESEDSDDETQFFLNDLFLNNHFFNCHSIVFISLVNFSNSNCFSSDFKQEVYSPPELG